MAARANTDMVKKRWRIGIAPLFAVRGDGDTLAFMAFVNMFAIRAISCRSMDADRLARLTDKQRACLRLVYAHMSSKEIAPHLGVEPGTVDQYIKAAMRILGVSDRRAAARTARRI